MLNPHRQILAATVSVLLVAIMIGATFGIAFAKQERELQPNFNVIGGPRQAVTAEFFLSCIDEDDWIALYSWDPSQAWKRYVNPALVPDYVNSGGAVVEALVPGRGVYLIMSDDYAASSEVLLDTPGDTCT